MDTGVKLNTDCQFSFKTYPNYPSTTNGDRIKLYYAMFNNEANAIKHSKSQIKVTCTN